MEANVDSNCAYTDRDIFLSDMMAHLYEHLLSPEYLHCDSRDYIVFRGAQQSK
jgi:hypothetical protein